METMRKKEIRKKRSVCVLLFVAIAIGALLGSAGGNVFAMSGQTGKNNSVYGDVSGSVLWENGDPIAGVEVALGNRKTTADDNGRFLFENVIFSRYTLSARVDGEIHSVVVNVTAPEVGVNVVVPIESVNHVVNNGFEELRADSVLPIGWHTRTDSPVMEFSVDSEVVRSGTYSMRLKGVNEGGNRGTVYQRSNAPEGTYRFTAWYMTEGLTRDQSAVVRIRYFDENGTDIDSFSQDPQFEVLSQDVSHAIVLDRHLFVYGERLPEKEWRPIEVEFVTPVGTEIVSIELYLWADEGTVWWDDIVLERI